MWKLQLSLGKAEKHRFALVSGALTFFIVFAPLQELNATRTDNPVGMSFAGLAFLAGLGLLERRVWLRLALARQTSFPFV